MKDGIVGLPLSPHDASRIRVQATDAAQTSSVSAIVDKDDLICDLGPSKFELRNPAWHSFAQDVALKAVNPFGIGTAFVTPRSLRLRNGKGGFEKRKTNSEQARDVIGTLLIILQSKHEGGDILLSHGEDTKRFAPSVTSEFAQSYVAWYSDVKVDVETIVSGQRLQLVYDIRQEHWPDMDKPSAAVTSEKAREFQSILGRWTSLCRNGEGVSPSVYIVEDNLEVYKSRSLGRHSLHDTHKSKVLYLQEYCRRMNICLYLATMTSEIEGEEMINPPATLELVGITDLAGKKIVSENVSENVSVEKENLIDDSGLEWRLTNDSDHEISEPDDPWEEVEPREEDGFRNLKDWVLVLLPENDRLKFLTDNVDEHDLDEWILRLSPILRNADQPGTLQTEDADNVNKATDQSGSMLNTRKELSFVCEKALLKMRLASQRSQHVHFYAGDKRYEFGNALGNLVQAMLLLGDRTLFCAAIVELPEALAPKVWREVGHFLDRDNFIKYNLAYVALFYASTLARLNVSQITTGSYYDEDNPWSAQDTREHTYRLSEMPSRRRKCSKTC